MIVLVFLPISSILETISLLMPLSNLSSFFLSFSQLISFLVSCCLKAAFSAATSWFSFLESRRACCRLCSMLLGACACCWAAKSGSFVSNDLKTQSIRATGKNTDPSQCCKHSKNIGHTTFSCFSKYSHSTLRTNISKHLYNIHKVVSYKLTNCR